MNFFLADVQTAFGAFVAFYLADLGWQKGQVGLALGVGTLAGVISQIPGGALVDAVRWKRGLTAIGIGFLCLSALIFALMPSFALVFVAEIPHGLTAGIVTPAIAAISLGLVGRRAMSVRTGRNYRFNAAGNALTAGLMGLAGQYFAKSAIFFGAAALCIPALIALGRIRSECSEWLPFRWGVALAAVEMQQPALARELPIAIGVVVLIAAAATSGQGVSSLIPGGPRSSKIGSRESRRPPLPR